MKCTYKKEVNYFIVNKNKKNKTIDSPSSFHGKSSYIYIYIYKFIERKLNLAESEIGMIRFKLL